MNKKKTITNYNNKDNAHGYQQWYNTYNNLMFRGNYKNDAMVTYIEWHALKKNIYFIR